MRKVADDIQLGPFMRHEHATIAEVFSQYELSKAKVKTAWSAISTYWYLGPTGPFRAYNTAHWVAANIANKVRRKSKQARKLVQPQAEPKLAKALEVIMGMGR